MPSPGTNRRRGGRRDPTPKSRPRPDAARLPSSPFTADVAIVGAGASGLIAAHRLQRAGLRVVVLEARARVGGRIDTPPRARLVGRHRRGGALLTGERAAIDVRSLLRA